VLLAGCSRDARLRKEVAGDWAESSHFNMTMSPDGSFVSHWIAPDKSLTYQGTWKIQDGKITTTLTNCIADGYSNFEPIGSVDHYAILRADAIRLVYSNDTQIISFRRK
jgi:hypothetical protein